MTETTHHTHKPWASRFARLHPSAYLGLHVTLGLLLSGLFTWAFFAIAEALTHRSAMAASDKRLADWVEQHNTELGEHVALAISLLGNQLLWTIFAGATIWFLARRAWRKAALLVVGGAGGYLLNTFLKSYFHRGRPVYAAEFSVDAGSFPSGHAMNAIVVYGILAYLVGGQVHDGRRRAWLVIGTTLLILSIAFTRVYLNVHFLSDVAAGLAAGGIWLSVCVTAYAFARRWHVAE